MERLTKKLDGSVVFPKELVGVAVTPDNSAMCALLCRLAVYEDTGLMPEEIKELLHDTTGPLHHKLGEWIDADTSGRLVVLPCKVGDTVYRVFNPPDREPVISAHTLMSADYIVRWLDKFGKTVFLTREEALEAAHGTD